MHVAYVEMATLQEHGLLSNPNKQNTTALLMVVVTPETLHCVHDLK